MWYKALYTYITAQQSTYNKISSEWQVYRGDVSNFRWKEGGIELEMYQAKDCPTYGFQTKHKTYDLAERCTFFQKSVCWFFLVQQGMSVTAEKWEWYVQPIQIYGFCPKF